MRDQRGGPSAAVARLELVAILAAGTVHDLNNLLTVLTASAELALAEPDPGEQRLLLRQLLGATERARELSARVMAVAGGENEFQPVDLNQVAADMAQLVDMGRRGLPVVDCRLAPAPLLVLGDPSMLKQAVANLLINACHASAGACGYVGLRTWAEGPGAHVEVEDHGPGVDGAARDRIFEPMWSGRPGGHGLGLALVAEIAARHRARVEVASEPGRGARFSLIFPRALGG